MKTSELPRHLSLTDIAFGEKGFRDILDEVVGFKEITSSLSYKVYNNNDIKLIKKLKEGIKNGTIIKQMQSDGTYIWKCVKK